MSEITVKSQMRYTGNGVLRATHSQGVVEPGSGRSMSIHSIGDKWTVSLDGKAMASFASKDDAEKFYTGFRGGFFQ